MTILFILFVWFVFSVIYRKRWNKKKSMNYKIRYMKNPMGCDDIYAWTWYKRRWWALPYIVWYGSYNAEEAKARLLRYITKKLTSTLWKSDQESETITISMDM